MRQLLTNVGTDYVALAITGIVVLIVSLIYLWWNEKNQGKLSIPGLSSKDETSQSKNFENELGNLGEISKDGGLHQFLADNHKKFGSMFSFYWEKELVVSLASPQVWKDTQTLFDRPANQFELFKPLIGADSIQYKNGNLGQRHRKLLDRHYSFTAIGSYYEIFNKIGDELVSKWKTIPKDEHVPLRQHMLALALKSIVRSSFGAEYFKTNKEILELEKAYDTCWEDMESRLDGEFPEPGGQREKDFKGALKLLRDKCTQVINHRRAMKNKSEHNLLDVILEADDLYTNDEQIFNMFISYMVGGFHTTGNLMTWVVYFLCLNPDVELKLFEEIDRELGDEDFKMDDMEKLEYTRQVIDESLRCSVLAPYAARYSEYDMVIGGHVIPKQTPLIHALGVVLQDETIWPEPRKFNPDRFTPELNKKRHPLTFQPFGFAGKRKCPGYRFAYYEATVFIVAIVRNFKVKLVAGQKVEMRHRLVTQPKEEIYVTVEARK